MMTAKQAKTLLPMGGVLDLPPRGTPPTPPTYRTIGGLEVFAAWVPTYVGLVGGRVHYMLLHPCNQLLQCHFVTAQMSADMNTAPECKNRA